MRCARSRRASPASQPTPRGGRDTPGRNPVAFLQVRLDRVEGAAVGEDEPFEESQQQYCLVARVFKGVIHIDQGAGGEGLQAGRSAGLLSGGRSMGVLSLVGQRRGFMAPIGNDAAKYLRVDRFGDEIHRAGSRQRVRSSGKALAVMAMMRVDGRPARS